MKRLCLLFLVLILCSTVVTPAVAAQNNVPIHISGDTYYDSSEKAFLFYVDVASSRAVRSSVADGMITNQAVTLKADAGVALAVYLDGKRLEGISGGTFRTPGEYVAMYTGGTIAERVLSFRIVPQLCNNVTSYTLPMGFEMTEATLDDVAVPFEKNHIRLDGEGQYMIRYRCIKTDTFYQLQLQTDFTGPVLALKGVTDGMARGPVDISDAKNAAVVNIYHNGEKINKKDVLTESGEYHIELADEAGNKTTYTFTILVYFDGNSWLFFLMVLAACVSVIIYLLHSRKHLRVR
jgi:hypothetical protein